MPDDIITYGTEILREKAADYEEFNEDIRELIKRMYRIMAENRGLGLAGPQIGVPRRIFVYDIGDGPHAVVNPRMLKSSGEVWNIEGCLSVPGLQGEVARAVKITVEGIDEHGEKIRIKAEGLQARVFQHEMDHLDGTLFLDRADPDTLEVVPVGSAGEDSEEDTT